MASLIKEIRIDASADDVWDALRDFGAVHERLVPGFVVESRLEGDSRVITFFNGVVARETLVGIDDEARRLSYSAVESPLATTHHNASAQVFADGAHTCRFVWTTDVLPDEASGPIDELMERGIGVIKHTMELRSATP
jgi:hypothetical protein